MRKLSNISGEAERSTERPKEKKQHICRYDVTNTNKEHHVCMYVCMYTPTPVIRTLIIRNLDYPNAVPKVESV